MYRFKLQQKKKIIFDIILIISLNTLFWIFIREKDLFELLHEYNRTHQEYQLDKFIPLIFVLLLSFLYFSIRRWRESAKFVMFAERRVSKDALTKLYNRRALESKLLLEWQRFIRYKESFCLIMIDIDGFKLINDSFGHQEGDRVIIEVSEKLFRNTRKTDFCARWGGTEFLILCPVSELPPIVELAERLRADIYCLLKDGIELSISLGVSQADKKKSLEELLKEADFLLYKAKKTGGNCVVSG